MIGPQAGGGFLSPQPQQPQMQPGAGQYDDWSMQNQAQQMALMHAMHGMLAQQGQGNLQTGGMALARGANQALGNPIGQVLRPVGNAIQSGASGIRNLVSGAAPQSYTQGGATTLAAGSPGLSGGAASSAPSTAGAGTSAVLDSNASTLGQLTPALSLAGSAYSAYAGVNAATRTTENLHQALSYGISDEEEAKLRQEQFDKGIGSFGVGSALGLLGGGILGAAAGGAGGATQAYNAYDKPSDAWHAFTDLPSHPMSAFK